jgi:hypothetical protein
MPIEIIDEPLADRFHRVISPSFQVSPAVVRGTELMPEVVAGSMDASWSARFFPVRAVDFYRLRDVFVCGEGLVFDAAGRLFPSSVAQHSPAHIATAAQAVAVARAAGDVAGHAGPVLLCKKIGSFNFGHWLLEMWPRAVLARTELDMPGLRYAVHTHGGALRQVMIDGLALAGIGGDDILETPWEPQFFEDLIVIDGLTEHGSYMSPVAVNCLQPLIAQIPPARSERLYITRRDIGWRRLQNEDAMIRIAEQEGYDVLEPARLALAQQISAFKGARRVVGVTGAAMTSIAFMAAGGQVDLFVPATMPDNFFWFISQIRGHRYTEYRCPEVRAEEARQAHGQSWNADLRISRAEFRKFIAG